MLLRNKILLYFSSTIILLIAVTFFVIFLLFDSYREEEFQQRQKEKILLTIKLLSEYKEIGEDLTTIMDKLTIHDFYDEKMLIFDDNKQPIYASVDDLEIVKSRELLNQISSKNIWLETKEDNYDVIGMYHKSERGEFYALSKAYDKFGYSKLSFLKNVLIILFFVFVVAVVGISLWLARFISKPITDLANLMENYTIENQKPEIDIKSNTQEIVYLNSMFISMINRVENAYSYQKHITSHISHELKTPVAILVSELEKISHLSDLSIMKAQLYTQVEKTKSLGDIINALLRLSKLESGQNLPEENLRIDELLLDIVNEIGSLNPSFYFDIQYTQTDIDENNLYLKGNRMLIKLAFYNILNNCINYSDNDTALINIDAQSRLLAIQISNSGPIIESEEQKLLFDYYFRGKNSEGKTGFGLGLVLAKKIFNLFRGSIKYFSPAENVNHFTVYFDTKP